MSGHRIQPPKGTKSAVTIHVPTLHRPVSLFDSDNQDEDATSSAVFCLTAEKSDFLKQPRQPRKPRKHEIRHAFRKSMFARGLAEPSLGSVCLRQDPHCENDPQSIIEQTIKTTGSYLKSADLIPQPTPIISSTVSSKPQHCMSAWGKFTDRKFLHHTSTADIVETICPSPQKKIEPAKRRKWYAKRFRTKKVNVLPLIPSQATLEVASNSSRSHCSSYNQTSYSRRNSFCSSRSSTHSSGDIW